MGIIGILNKATDARKNTIIGKEKEAISLAWNALMTDKITKGTEITNTNFKDELNRSGNTTNVENYEENSFLVTFLDTGNSYIVDKDGNVSEIALRKINYVLNGGENPEGQVTSFKTGKTVSLLNATKDNAYFQGWYESSDFSTNRVTSISNRNEDITLYAKWVEETPTGYFTWTTTQTEATLTGFSSTGLTKYNEGRITELAIPRKYDGLNVTTISQNAFKDKTLLNTLIIPDNITTLNKSSFSGCNSIQNLLIPISLDATSKNSYPDSEQPFYGCTGIKNISFTKGNRNRSELFMVYKYNTTVLFLEKRVLLGIIQEKMK